MRSVGPGRAGSIRGILLLGWIVIAVPACTGYPGARTDGAPSPGTITAVAAYTAAVHGDTALIDVREPDEIQRGAPDRTAARITYRLDRTRDAQFVDQTLLAVADNRSASVTLVCASGVRSAAARDLLLRHGFTDVKSLDGGFQAWRASRLPSTPQAPSGS
jgi:rhodanese-related sulfurtransferase